MRSTERFCHARLQPLSLNQNILGTLRFPKNRMYIGIETIDQLHKFFISDNNFRNAWGFHGLVS